MDFKFSIGDIVTTKESLLQYEYLTALDKEKEFQMLFNKPYMPISLFVLTRRLEECPGGTQLHYLCRYFISQGYIEHWFNEIELVNHPYVLVKEENKEKT